MNEKVDKVDYETINPQGKIKIELFDARTGKRTQEVNANNFISKGVRQYLFRALMQSVFTKDRVTGGLDPTYPFEDLFGRIALTAYDGPEKPDEEWLLRRRSMGWASTTETYSGSDTIRGTYNASESFTTSEQVHMVFDWPTHAGNGTFQSIYFYPRRVYAYSGSRSYMPVDYHRPELGNCLSLKHYDGKVYALKNAGLLEVYSYPGWVLEASYNLPGGSLVRDLTAFNDMLYFVVSDSNKSIQKAPIANPLELTTVLTGYQYMTGIDYAPSRQQFIISRQMGSGSGSERIIVYCDTSFALLNEFQHTMYSGDLGSNQVFVSDECLFVRDMYIDLDDVVYRSLVSPLSGSGKIVGFLNDDKIVFQYGDVNSVYVFPKLYIGSRSLLDTPVTKTSNVTMKITYDFLLPSLYD